MVHPIIQLSVIVKAINFIDEIIDNQIYQNYMVTKGDNLYELAKRFNTSVDQITATTKFRDLEEWSSIIALAIIAMIDEEYDITIKGDDMRAAETVEDLFNIVKSKM